MLNVCVVCFFFYFCVSGVVIDGVVVVGMVVLDVGKGVGVVMLLFLCVIFDMF